MEKREGRRGRDKAIEKKRKKEKKQLKAYSIAFNKNSSLSSQFLLLLNIISKIK